MKQTRSERRDHAADCIKVAIRVRGFNQREKDLGSPLAVSMDGAVTTLKSPKEGEEPFSFTFDYSWWSFDSSSPTYASQETIMRDIGEDLLTNAIEGFNGCLFAYGQTGSGKTYSIIGSKDAPGVIPRTIARLFAEKSKLEADPQQELRLWASYLEIYNEDVYDLLTKEDKHELKVMDHPRLGVLVRDLSEVPCQTCEEVNKLMDMGVQKRAVGATHMNAASSRSHTVFTLKLQRLRGTRPPSGAQDSRHTLTAKINLVDLAGSERGSKTGATGKRQREAGNINQSLSALARIIHLLGAAMAKADAQGLPPPSGKDLGHLAWRTSKLTFLLRDSLAGNSKTVMVAAISPATDNWEETLGTLEFAASVKKIKMSASRNEHKQEDLIEKMKEELEELRAQVSGGAEAHQRVVEEERLIEEMRHTYEAQLQKTQDLLASRAGAVEDMMLSRDELNAALGLSPDTPYLVNMSDDPALAGSLFYCIPEGKSITAGSGAESVIHVPGAGVPSELCVIERQGGSTVTLTKVGQGRVQVKGKLLEDGASHPLEHGLRLVLGRRLALKVIMPSADMNHSAPDVDNLALEGLEQEWASIEGSPSWGRLQGGLDELIKEMSVESAKALTEMVEEVVHACDEANEITADCRADEDLHFEAHLVVTPPASVGVRVLKNCAEATAGGIEQGTCLYFWTTGKLLERLERMRGYHRAFSRTGQPPMAAHSMEDPWHEVPQLELALTMAEQGHKLDDALREKEQLQLTGARSDAELQQQLERSTEIEELALTAITEAKHFKELTESLESAENDLIGKGRERQMHLDAVQQQVHELEATVKLQSDSITESCSRSTLEARELRAEVDEFRIMAASNGSAEMHLQSELKEMQSCSDEASGGRAALDYEAKELRAEANHFRERAVSRELAEIEVQSELREMQVRLHEASRSAEEANESRSEANQFRDLAACQESREFKLKSELDEMQTTLEMSACELHKLKSHEIDLMAHEAQEEVLQEECPILRRELLEALSSVDEAKEESRHYQVVQKASDFLFSSTHALAPAAWIAQGIGHLGLHNDLPPIDETAGGSGSASSIAEDSDSSSSPRGDVIEEVGPAQHHASIQQLQQQHMQQVDVQEPSASQWQRAPSVQSSQAPPVTGLSHASASAFGPQSSLRLSSVGAGHEGERSSGSQWKRKPLRRPSANPGYTSAYRPNNASPTSPGVSSSNASPTSPGFSFRSAVAPDGEVESF